MMRGKILTTHLTRKAIVYLRQSSLNQVRNNRESTIRQYALRERAIGLGWHEDDIEVIDEDLGLSGKNAENRTGFQCLAEQVAHGKIGALFAIEISRLARSSADWYRLLDLAGLADVLIVDEEAVYNPREYNDRLLLGLKGQFADAELYWLRLRLNGGKLSKARRGEVCFTSPTGYVWRERGQLQFDPDEHVQRSVRLVFERFRLEPSAAAVVRYFAQNNLQMPVRDRTTQEIRWTAPKHRRVLNFLHNPVYTGAYVFGKSESRTVLIDGNVRYYRTGQLPIESWKVCLKDHHPAYISWEEYLANQKKLRDNSLGERKTDPSSRGAAKTGFALLQGLCLCGRCGQRMHVRYHGTKRRYALYLCIGEKFKGDCTSGECWSVAATRLDKAVGEEFLKTIRPAEIDLSLAVTKDAEKQAGEIFKQWKLRLENARYETRWVRLFQADDSTVSLHHLQFGVDGVS